MILHSHSEGSVKLSIEMLSSLNVENNLHEIKWRTLFIKPVLWSAETPSSFKKGNKE